MIGQPTPGREWSTARKLGAVRNAGFDAVCAHLTPELKALADRLGLRTG